MRPNVDPEKIERLMQALGREAQGSGCIYFTGGASALLIGWRSSVDIRLDPEPPGIFQAIAKLKQELNINIELASPQDFLPPLPGWRDRSVFIGKQGKISFYHYDFTAQALSTHIPHPQLSQSVFTVFYKKIKLSNILKLLILTDKADLKGIIYSLENIIL
jgi:hypothetical protein